MWEILANLLGGPIVSGLVKASQAKLTSDNTAEKIAAGLAARELSVEQRERELAVQQNIADEGRWWTAAPRAVACWSFAIFIAKCVVWDKVLGLGTTDPLGGFAATTAIRSARVGVRCSARSRSGGFNEARGATP